MRKLTKFLAIVLLLCIVTSSLASCEMLDSILGSLGLGGNKIIDYAAEVKLDWSSSTAKVEVESVKSYIDGDTTHFYVPKTVIDASFIKARYLGVDTPESTGKIEEWGKAASKFTKSKLEAAVSIVIESDDENWNVDSTGDRYLLWIWYKTAEDAEYRNLNIELLQNGLAIANKSANNRYGEICMKAISQAKENNLKIYSDEVDPDFFYGDAYPITLKELSTNAQAYEGSNVAVEGVVTRKYDNGAYIESFNEEDGIYYGFYMYYGFNLPGPAISALSEGNYVRVVGSVQNFYGSWQITGILYKGRDTENPNSSACISKGHTPSYVETDPRTFATGTLRVVVNADGEEVMEERPYAQLVFGTSVSMKNLKVTGVYTTTDPESSDKGAMTLTCEVDGVTISVRTAVLKDVDGKLITEEYFKGKTMDILGIVDCHNGSYQIRLLSIDDVTFH